MISRHHLVEIKCVKELPLSTLSLPHHGLLPRIAVSVRRNHGSPTVSTRVLQHNLRQSGHGLRMAQCLRLTPSGLEWAAFTAMHGLDLLYSHDAWAWAQRDEAARVRHAA